MAAKNDKLDSFEKKLTELEDVVRALETGDVDLAKAVAQFERGMRLSKDCEALLNQAELRVEQLLADEQGESLQAVDEPA